MVLIAFVLVLLSAIIHSLWNLFAKQSIHKITFLWLIHVISFVMILPYFLMKISDVTLQGFTIVILLLSMFFQIIYIISLSISYSWGDYSQTYPILRGTASLVVPILSIVIFREYITVLGWLGIIIIFFGIFSLSEGANQQTKKARLATLFAIAGGLSITGYTISDKFLLDHMDPIIIIQFQNFFHMIGFGWASFTAGKINIEWKTNWKIILLGALFMPGAYLVFLFALKIAQVGQLAPIREISIVFGAILGALILKEKQGKRTIISSIVIVIGVIILGLYG